MIDRPAGRAPGGGRMRIVVIGAGVVGTMAAYWLARDGHAVTVVERREGPALETSFANGAIVHPSSVEPWSGPRVPLQILRWLGREDAPFLLRPKVLPRIWRWGLAFLRACTAERHRAAAVRNLALALESLEGLALIRAETGIVYDFRPRAVLEIARDPEALEAADRAHAPLRAAGLEVVRLDRAALVALEPALAPVADRLAGALHYPQDEIGDCAAFTRGIAAWCATQGVTFHWGTAVTGLRVEAGRLRAVTTAAGTLGCEVAVVAAGPWTPALLAPLGLRVPIVPVKGVSLTAPRRLWPEAPRHAILDGAAHYALVPVGERLRLAGSAELGEFDARPAPGRIRALVERVSELFPAMRAVAASPEAVAWAGLRPATPHGEPLLGPTRIAGLWLDAGHGHIGWTSAAGSGRRLAARIGGRAPEGPPVA